MEYSEDTQRLITISRNGDFMRDFQASEFWGPINETIFDALDRKAFETFKKIDPSDTMGIMQAQMMSKVIAQIRQEIDRIIQQGLLAREQLAHIDDE
jgi:hypothetical protein